MTSWCRGLGHEYVEWVEPHERDDGTVVPNFLGWRCALCGATFPGATSKPTGGDDGDAAE